MPTLKETIAGTGEAMIVAMAGGGVAIGMLSMYQNVPMISYGESTVIACIIGGGAVMAAGMLISAGVVWLLENEYHRMVDAGEVDNES